MADFKDILAEVAKSRFSLNTPVPADNSNFKIFVQDELFPVGSPACIGMFTGRQKSRKTFALSLVKASALAGKPIGPFSYEPNGGIILNFDTEQPSNRYLITERRLYTLADLTTDHDRYYSFNLRRYSFDVRSAVIDYIIKDYIKRQVPIDLIVIDGVVDLCENYNENAASSKTAQDLMTWTDMSGASLYTVLHMNKNGGEVRGHLGTELGNKADFTVSVYKKHDDDHYSTVSSKDSRYFPFRSFDLYQSRDGLLDLERGSWQSQDMGMSISDSPQGESKIDLPF
jgi:hypothetical protein